MLRFSCGRDQCTQQVATWQGHAKRKREEKREGGREREEGRKGGECSKGRSWHVVLLMSF